jgi:hypothetical protein
LRSILHVLRDNLIIYRPFLRESLVPKKGLGRRAERFQSCVVVLQPSHSCSITSFRGVCKPSSGNPHQGFSPMQRHLRLKAIHPQHSVSGCVVACQGASSHLRSARSGINIFQTLRVCLFDMLQGRQPPNGFPRPLLRDAQVVQTLAGKQRLRPIPRQ